MRVGRRIGEWGGEIGEGGEERQSGTTNHCNIPPQESIPTKRLYHHKVDGSLIINNWLHR